MVDLLEQLFMLVSLLIFLKRGIERIVVIIGVSPYSFL